MELQEAIEHVRAVLAGCEDFRPRLAPASLGAAHRLVEDLGVDSVALMDLAMGLEARLGVALDESELLDLGTVGAIAFYLCARKA